MNDTFDLQVLQADLVTDEGRSLKPYIDTRGNITIGVGRNLTGVGLSADEVSLLLSNDVQRATDELDLGYPWWRSLPPGAQRVMANLIFNVGPKSFAGFVKFIAAMQRNEWLHAAHELQNSTWYTQVGERGPRMCARLAAIK